MRNRSARGLTILQTLISAALLVIVLAGANAMVSAGTNVAQSTTNLGTASNRADHSLSAIADALRRGSLASVRLLNDTAFTDGSSDTGFKIRTVQTFTGTPVLSTPITYRLDTPSGASSGSLTRTQDGISRVLATGVTAFTVSRAGSLFTLDIRTRSGPTDDRARTIHAAVQVAARNP
jgi:hypothetical protein